MTTRRRPRGILPRVVLVGFGLVAGLASLELLLWLAGPLLRPGLRGFEQPRVSAPPGTIRILCVGDSHTYGLWVKPQQSYPARLQRQLTGMRGHFVVLNAGVPGMNSSQVRDAIPQLLATFSPDVVLLMVGVADGWNLTGSETESLRGWRWWLRGDGLWDRSRVIKLARLLWFNLTYRRYRYSKLPDIKVIEQTPADWKISGGDREIDVVHDAHFVDPITDPRIFPRILRRDLSVIVSAVEAHGARLILLTYPTEAFLYSAVNDVYREFATQRGLPLIDLAKRLQQWSLSPEVSIAFFPDFHPRPLGYKLIAQTLVETLPAQLGIELAPE